MVPDLIPTQDQETHHGVKVWFRIGRCRSFNLGTLDALSHHAFSQILAISQKILMVIPRRVQTTRQTVESVQIQLPLKAGELVLLKIPVCYSERRR